MSSHVEYHKFRRGETCTEEGCRAHRFYIEDGMKFCQRGHAQANFTLTQQDEDDFGTQGKKSRKKREEKERTQRVFTGEEAIDLYLQCFQLILWKQCHWLVTVKGFPKELKTVVRDLWGLRVRMFLKLNEDKTGYSSGTGTSGLSSASEGEDPGIDESQRKGWLARRRKRMIKASKMVPQLAETLTFSYLGILLLRLPFTLGDIFIWAKTQELPYFRAIKEIPKEMRLHLPSHYHASLEVRSNMKGEDLQATTLEVVKFFNHHFEMEFPPLNTPLLIFRHIRDLGLPVEIYCAVRRLAELLGIDFTYPVTPKRRQILDYPELQIMCLIVIATKLGQPFDNVVRHPTDESDPTTVKIDWQKWVQVMAEEPSKGIKPGSEIDVTDVDILKMDGKKLDDYLDWYQRTWIDDRKPKSNVH
ncbi:RNA polymerase I-specific transcription initiation factor-like protein rrn7 [Xylogone sp. PMI_703]|nr:RNA polymerase I-specific transcription initiation factor-like protein rrn7 [Xylogone sp. PMI_703]